jgi:hypothetical protein
MIRFSMAALLIVAVAHADPPVAAELAHAAVVAGKAS